MSHRHRGPRAQPARRPRIPWPAHAALAAALAFGGSGAAAGPLAAQPAPGLGPDPAVATFDPATFQRPAGWSTALRYWQTLGRAYAARGLPQPAPPAVRTAQVLAAAAPRPVAPAPRLATGPVPAPRSASHRTAAPGWGATLRGWLGGRGAGGARDARGPAPLPKDRLTLVILGTDRRPDDRIWRTDTVMIATVDWAAGRAGLLSVPRDLWVTIPGHGPGRINTADYLGQAAGLPDGELVKDTLAMNLGLRPDRFVRIDLQGFVRIVDTLGGLDLVVDCPVHDYFTDDRRLGGREAIDLEPGVHHVDGATALRYARSRHGSSDFARARRQQRVLRAVQAAIRRQRLWDNVPALWSAVAAHVHTDLAPLEIVTLGFRAAPLADRLDLRTRTLDAPATFDWVTPDGAEVLVMDPPAAAAVVADVLGAPLGDAAAAGARARSAPADDAAGGPRDAAARGMAGARAAAGSGPPPPAGATAPSTPAGPTAGRTAVVVVDATGRADWGTVAETVLAEHGVRAVHGGVEAPRDASTVYHRPGAEAAARRVGEALGLPPSAARPMPPTSPAAQGAPVRAVLGADWHPCPGGG